MEKQFTIANLKIREEDGQESYSILTSSNQQCYSRKGVWNSKWEEGMVVIADVEQKKSKNGNVYYILRCPASLKQKNSSGNNYNNGNKPAFSLQAAASIEELLEKMKKLEVFNAKLMKLVEAIAVEVLPKITAPVQQKKETMFNPIETQEEVPFPDDDDIATWDTNVQVDDIPF